MSCPDAAAQRHHPDHRPPEQVDAKQADPGVENTTERLMTEFGARIDLPTVAQIVLRCRRELNDAPALALPELLERHARQRLLNTIVGPPVRR